MSFHLVATVSGESELSAGGVAGCIVLYGGSLARMDTVLVQQ